MNCLSWKKTCSPAVKTNSAPQSTHLSTRSVNSIAGFPQGPAPKSAMARNELAGSGALFSFVLHHKGPVRAKKLSGTNILARSSRAT
jgi:hypothetical protein